MDWQVTARRALLGLVALLFVSGQVQVWWEPEPSDVTGAAAVLLLTAPLPWARRRPLPAGTRAHGPVGPYPPASRSAICVLEQ